MRHFATVTRRGNLNQKPLRNGGLFYWVNIMQVVYSDVPRRHSRKVFGRELWYKVVSIDELENALKDNWRKEVEAPAKIIEKPVKVSKKVAKKATKVK